jgi:hypothetical protein
MAGYKNYGVHFRRFLTGTLFSIALSMLIAALSVYLIPLL